jgi:hypothetical protein
MSWAFYEHASEASALGAAAGTHLAPEQDALPKRGERWNDPAFGRVQEPGRPV